MIDKTIINGVNVSQCFYFFPGQKYKNKCRCEGCSSLDCSDNFDCYYKQLQRKTTECKRYKQALNEIEEICRQLLDSPYSRNEAESILDIINKAKDGEE